MPTDWVIGHHEAGGKPNRRWNDDRYSLVIGDGDWTLNHGPEGDKATMGLNGKVFSFCFRGMRHKAHWYSIAWEVTDDDLRLLREGMAEARRRGYVTSNPKFNSHGDPELRKYGNATVCFGNLAQARRAEIEAATREPGTDWTPFIEKLGVLQPGDRNDRVKYLQGLLNIIFPDAGFKASGTYGPKTSEYVVRIRKLVGLNPNNKGTGPKVWAALIFFAGAKAK